MTTTFQCNKTTYEIKLTYGKAINTLPEKFHINITKLFSDGELATETLNTLVLDDEKTLRLMFHFMEPTSSMEFDQFLEVVTTPELEAFREAFWAEVVNFSGSLKKNMMLQLWNEFKRDLKATKLERQEMRSEPSSSMSSQEEST